MLFIWIFKKNVVILRRLMINTMMKHFFSFLLLLCGICSVYAELTPYKEGKLVGLKDDDGNVVVAPKYTAIGDYSGTYTWMNVGGKGGYEHCPLGGKWGVLNELGEVVCPAEYDYVDLCNDHYVNVNKGGVMTIDNRTFTGGLWGIYDLVAKKEVVPANTPNSVLSTSTVYAGLRRTERLHVDSSPTSSKTRKARSPMPSSASIPRAISR